MTDNARTVCDCPEPCSCYAEGYAAGKDKVLFEIHMVLQQDNHAASRGCEPYLVIRAVREETSASVSQETPSR